VDNISPLTNGYGHLECDAEPDDYKKHHTQCHKDSQPLIVPEGLSPTKDPSHHHTKAVTNDGMKYNSDATLGTTTQAVKGDKGTVCTNDPLQSAVSADNPLDLKSRKSAITQNFVKDGEPSSWNPM